MNTKNEKPAAEKISAYIDDALNESEIESLLAEDGTGEQAGSEFQAATRYHMIGDAIRGELSDVSMVDVSSNIHQALRHESMDDVESVRPVNKTSFFDYLSDFFAGLGDFSRPLTGMAVAASVAMLTVVLVVQMESPERAQLAVSPVVVPGTLIANKQPVNNLGDRKKQMAEFDTYINEYTEFAAQDTLPGRIPYVRAVSYELE